MKKFYTFIALALIAFVSFGAAAKSITMKTNEASSGLVSLVDKANGIDVTLTSTPQTINDIPDGYLPMQIVVADGYVLDKIITDYGGGYTNTEDLSDYKYSAYDSYWTNFSSYYTYEITVINPADIKPKTVTMIGIPGGYYASKVYSPTEAEKIQPNENGVAELDWAGINSFYIFSNEGYRIDNITDQTGKSYLYGQPATQASISTYGFTENEMTLNIDLTDLSKIEYKKFTVNVDENASTLMLRNQSNDTFTLADGANEIKFEEGAEFTLNSMMGSPLYSVTLNNVALEPVSNNYRFKPAEGDVVDVKVNFPEKEVPFKVTFAGGADASIITSVSYNNQSYSVEDFLSDDFKPMLGRKMYMSFDNSNFENIDIKVNGVSQAYTYTLEFYLTDEAGYDIEISATKLSPYINVTIEINDPEGVIIYQGYSPTGDTYALTGTTTVLEVPRANNSMYFDAAPDYIIKSITGGNFYYSTYNKTYRPTTDATLTIEVQKIVRDREAVVYVEPNISWDYLNVVLSPDDYTRTLNKTIDLMVANPYMTFEYGAFDTPFNFNGGYNHGQAPVYYVNGELVAVEQSRCPATDNLPSGSVIKIYSTKQIPVEVTFTVAKDIEFEVVEDLVTKLTAVTDHTVLPGTQIKLIPTKGTSMTVTANSESVSADKDGNFIVVADGKTAIDVKGVNSGIDGITVDNDETEVIYNLQGVRVNGDNLPSGIYIKNGKKFYKK